MQSSSKLFYQVVLIIIFPILLNASEILYEKNWTRIVTGDQVIRLTRNISEQPIPLKINEATVKNILNKMSIAEPSSSQLKAWLLGLKLYGWAQQENEPEHESYCAIQLIIIENKKPELLVKNFKERGQITEALFSIEGEQLFYKNIEMQEILNRDVFYTVLSPALFILNQEHFQKQFFEEMLDLDYPGFEATKKAYESKKILLAAHEVAEYFRRKEHPIWNNRSSKNQINKETTGIDEAADKVLRHEFQFGHSTIYMGERIDYRNNPTHNLEWIWGLNRMNHWVTLLHGYEKTDNEMYAEEFNRDVIDWVVRNPAPAFRLTRVPSWRNLEVGDRMSKTWPESFFGFLSSSSFQTQAIQLMLASIWSHAQHIKQFPSGLKLSSNWSIVESNGLAAAGMYFPEFKDSEQWIDLGFKRLFLQMELQIYPDGVQHELSPGYHFYCLRSFYQSFDVARKIKKLIPKNYADVLEKMTEYLMYISSPAKEAPPSNDSYRFDIRQWMQLGAHNFNRDDMLFIATDGEKGTPPEKTSVHFPWAGQSVMRSGWESDEWYLFFDAGPTGVNHQNEDKLHIGVSAFGRLFITDAGISSYIPDKWRRYFTSTQAHNTIIIDGVGQKRMPQKETHRADSPLKNSWISNENIDFASGTYSDGYGDDLIPVTHSRFVLFKKKEYWIVIDKITGEGKHSFENLFHLTLNNVQINEKENSIQTLYDDNKNIKLVSNSTVKMKLDIIKGEENPEQGWISLKHNGRIASPTAVYKGSGKLPILIATVIQPFMEKTAPNIQIEFNESSSSEANIIVHTNKGDDHWIVNLEKENRILVNGMEVDEAISFKRDNNDKTIEKFTLRFKE
ncbi:MAG: alginate lyase family protein [Bacteroidota bacterium]